MLASQTHWSYPPQAHSSAIQKQFDRAPFPDYSSSLRQVQKADGCPSESRKPTTAAASCGSRCLRRSTVSSSDERAGCPRKRTKHPRSCKFNNRRRGREVCPNAEVGAPCAGCPKTDVEVCWGWGCEKAGFPNADGVNVVPNADIIVVFPKAEGAVMVLLPNVEGSTEPGILVAS